MMMTTLTRTSYAVLTVGRTCARTPGARRGCGRTTPMVFANASRGHAGARAGDSVGRFAESGTASWRATREGASGKRGRAASEKVGGRRASTVARGGGGGGGDGGGSGGGGNGGNGGNGDGSSSNGVSSLWAAYLNSLEKNPLATKCVTSGLLNALGDLFAQFMFDGAAENGVDWRRAGVFTFLGAALVGPTLHFWYGTLGKIVTAQGSTKAFISLVLDQGLFAPAFLCVFLSSLFTIDGKMNEIVPKLKQDFAATVSMNWNIWIPFQYLNFRFVPLNLQVAAANVVALLWNTYLSWASHKEVVVETKGKKK